MANCVRFGRFQCRAFITKFFSRGRLDRDRQRQTQRDGERDSTNRSRMSCGSMAASSAAEAAIRRVEEGARGCSSLTGSGHLQDPARRRGPRPGLVGPPPSLGVWRLAACTLERATILAMTSTLRRRRPSRLCMNVRQLHGGPIKSVHFVRYYVLKICIHQTNQFR